MSPHLQEAVQWPRPPHLAASTGLHPEESLPPWPGLASCRPRVSAARLPPPRPPAGPGSVLVPGESSVPGITDHAIKGQSGCVLAGERNEAVRQGAWPRAVTNVNGQPTRCGRRCQEMIAYKMYQLPPCLRARPRCGQINTSAASLCQPGLGEGPGTGGADGRAWEGHREVRRPSLSPGALGSQ